MIWYKFLSQERFIICAGEIWDLLKNYLVLGHFSCAVIFDYYKDCCLLFAGQLLYVLKNYFEEDVFFCLKKISYDWTYFQYPFRVFNQLFRCSRSYYWSDICFFCTRFNVKQKDTSDYIKKKIFVPIDFFLSSIREDILLIGKVYLSVYYHGAFANKKIYSGYSNNFWCFVLWMHHY